MNRRWFTPQSAREALQIVRPAAERVCRLYRGLEALRPAEVVPDQPVDRRYFSLVTSMHMTLAEIGRLGVEVKDIRQGLIDFPARRAGREVLLCWQVGEPALAFWHEKDAGFAGRQPLDDEGPWDVPLEQPEPVG